MFLQEVWVSTGYDISRRTHKGYGRAEGFFEMAHDISFLSRQIVTDVDDMINFDQQHKKPKIQKKRKKNIKDKGKLFGYSLKYTL